MDEDRKKAIEKYNKLMKDYGLPPLEELEEELDFILDEDVAIAKNLINQIWERISSMKSYIEGVLNPQRYCCIIETKFLNPKEKEKVFNFYKEIMIEYWKTVKATFDSPEEKIRKVKSSYEFYKKVKNFSKEYIQRMIDGWSDKDSSEDNKETYIN